MRNDTVQFSELDLPLEEVDAPTLIVHGTLDNNVPFSHAELLAAKVPGARLHVIAGGDHMMPFTHEDDVNSTVDAFIQMIE